MLLAIDAGNTNTVFAVFDGGRIIGQWRISTHPKRTADEYAVWLSALMERSGILPDQISDAIAASVVPHMVFDLRMLCHNVFHLPLKMVGEEGLETGIGVALPRPQEVGADRLVNALAAKKRYGTPVIVLDFGTATTFDVVGETGEYIGGVIAPGIHLSLEALHQATSRLPSIAIEAPPAAIGTDTVSAMQSGIFYGYIGLIEGIVARIRAQLGKENTKVIATGGLASLYASASKVLGTVEPDLTILGLNDIYQLNQK